MNSVESYKQQMNKFSVGSFCFFDAKKKEPFGGGEPRQDGGI